jgi:hypothetical protein
MALLDFHRDTHHFQVAWLDRSRPIHSRHFAQALHIARQRAVSLAHVVSRILSEANRGDVAAAKRGCVRHDGVLAPAAYLETST